MEIRVLTTKYLTCILATITLSAAQTLITKDTTWSDDLILRKSVIVSENAILTIKAGVSVFIEYIDTDNDEAGDIEITVFGSIHIDGTPEAMVAIKPIQNTVNKSYWKGIMIQESNYPSSIEFLKLSNAQIGLNIKSKLRARGLSLDNCGSIGINIESTLSDSIDLKDIEIIKSDGVGLFIDKGNVFIDWAYIHRCEGIGIVNNNFGVVDIKNTKIIKNKDNGISNYGTMTVYNLVAKENRHGIVCSSGIAVVTKGNISDNRANGLLVGGSSNVNIESTTIRKNGGYGLEVTDWKQEDYLSFWDKGGSPAVKINQSNFMDNYKTTVLDEYRYDNIWKDWTSVEYTGDGWVENWQEYKYLEAPFGTIGWIGFQYNSNNGGSEFSWQPCTGNSVWSSIFEVKNSRDQTLTYLSAPFQCSWNPLAGENSNTWHQYGEYTGMIDSTNNYSDWFIQKENILSSNKYMLRQYFNYAYIPGEDSSFVVRPKVSDFKLSFYHGGKEVSSYSDNNEINLSSNYWGAETDEFSMVNPYGNTDLTIDEKLSAVIDDGGSTLENKNNINIYTPSEGLAYQEIKMLDISWQTKGWIPMVDIFLSVDNGFTWEKIASDIKNSGKFSWWNNLIIGEKFYIKIVDSYNQNNSSLVGPCDVIENITPIIDVSTDQLNFITGKSAIDFSIKNIGGGLLKWSLVPDASWISLSRDGGSTKKESVCTARVKRTGLTMGKYNGSILIRSNSEEKRIAVTMIVTRPSLYVDTKYLSFDSTKTSHTFNIKNFGGGTLFWEIQTEENWIMMNPDKGSLRSGTTVSISIDRSRLRIGSNETMLKLKSNAGEKIIEVSAFRSESFMDTVRTQLHPWHWRMYDYGIY
jgi:hypothetical protein